MTDYKYSHQHNLTFRITKTGYNEYYLANIIEIPAIIVRASSREELQKEIRVSLKLYFETACDKHEKINVIFTDDLNIYDSINRIKVICYSKVNTDRSHEDNPKSENKKRGITKSIKFIYARVTYFFLSLFLKK